MTPQYTTLIDAEALHAHLGHHDWIVFDCRHDLSQPEAGSAAYRSGHIPGARFAHLDHDLSAEKNGRNGRHPLPAPATFAAWLRSRGVCRTSQVVVYDASGSMFAARLWWMLRALGHDATAVLDGGLPAWLTAGYPVDESEPECRAGDINCGSEWVGTVGIHEVEKNLAARTRLIIDARAAERYRGEIEPLDARAGHIPGALNRSFALNLTSDGRFKPAAVLRAEFTQQIGAHAPSAVIHQCGSGVSACHNLLAMETAGLPGAALYPGSWSEWSADSSKPVATGSV